MPATPIADNAQRRARLRRLLAPVTRSVDRQIIRRAPYALRTTLSEVQLTALVDHASELGGPPGLVIGREIPTDAQGCEVEVLIGWERVEAYLHRDAYPRATQVPMATLAVADEDAAYYAIEQAKLDSAGAGYPASTIEYALASMQALTYFNQGSESWSIQRLANALCIARPTLSNRLRLLTGLAPSVRTLLETQTLKPELAKILLAESDPAKQTSLAEQAVAGQWSTRALYQQVHPGYQPPQTTAVKRQPRSKKQPVGDLALMERTLQETFAAPARILTEDLEDAVGQIDLRFYSLSELKGLIDRLARRARTDTLFEGRLSLSAGDANTLDRLLRETGAITDPLEE